MIQQFAKPRRFTITSSGDGWPFWGRPPRAGDVLTRELRNGKEGGSYLVLSVRPVMRRTPGNARVVAACRRIALADAPPGATQLWMSRE